MYELTTFTENQKPLKTNNISLPIINNNKTATNTNY